MKKSIQNTIVIFFLSVFSHLTYSGSYEINDASFLGGKVGYGYANNQDSHSTISNGAIVGLYGGLYITGNISIDLGYQYHIVPSSSDGTNVNVSFIESGVRYDFYQKHDLYFYGRVGVGQWGMSTEYQQKSINDTGFSPIVEVGSVYKLSNNVEVNIGYQYINHIGSSKTGTYNSHGLISGLRFHLGKGNDTTVVVNPTDVIKKEKLPLQDRQTSLHTPIKHHYPALNFAFDSDEVNGGDAHANYHKLLERLKKDKSLRIKVIGYTDSKGADQYNFALSKRRAISLAKWLEANGINKEQVSVEGRGGSNFLATNLTPEGRALNRRVELIMVK